MADLSESQHWLLAASVRCDRGSIDCPGGFEEALAAELRKALLAEARRFLAGRTPRYGIDPQDLAQIGYLACQALLRGTSRFEVAIELRLEGLGCTCAPLDAPTPSKRLMTCLLVRARSRWLDVFRRPWHEWPEVEEHHADTDGLRTERLIELKEMSARLEAALPRLKTKEREVILADLRGERAAEVCARLDISASSLRLHRYRAKRKLGER